MSCTPAYGERANRRSPNMEHRASRAHAARTSRSMEPLPVEDQLGGAQYGEGDAVIKFTSNDLESLQPGNLLSGIVVDFYIKYLLEDPDHCRFFDYMFLESAIQEGDATTRWQNWNVFEKEYVLIPVHQSSHWSLIILCHLTSFASSADNHEHPPCILHVDSWKGKHEKLRDDIWRYFTNALREKFPNPTANQLLKFRNMTYWEAKVPQQENEYDSGIYLLVFVELFLLRPNQDTFVAAWDVSEVSDLRRIIRDLIEERALASKRKLKENQRKIFRHSRLNRNLKGQDGARLNVNERCSEDQHNNDMMELDSGVTYDEREFEEHRNSGELAANGQHTGVEHVDQQTSGEIELDNQPQLASAPVKRNKRGKNWSNDETSILLECKLEGAPRFCKSTNAKTVTDWNAISKEIWKRLRTANPPSGDQCQSRYDTLLKAYRKAKEHCEETGKQFSELRPGEVKLTTNLLPEWYKALDEINRSPSKSRSSKDSPAPVDARSDSTEELQLPSMSRSESPHMLRDLERGLPCVRNPSSYSQNYWREVVKSIPTGALPYPYLDEFHPFREETHPTNVLYP